MSAETLHLAARTDAGAAAVETFLQAAGALIDVRSPGEYAQGHLPGAVNVPLFNDEERAEIGTLYKHQGRQQAVLKGLARVGPRLDDLAGRLLALAGQGTEPLRLYCWRGGMRSASVAWLADTVAIRTTLLPGGYKAFRRWVLAGFERQWPLLLLTGRTGTGKTDLLLALRQRGAAVIDLEGQAHHRGSSFGGLGLPPQPSSEHFENKLAIDLHRFAARAPIWLEGESAQVGRCRIPNGLWRQMQQAPTVELSRSQDERVQRLVDVYGDLGAEALAEATLRISKRLGPQRTAAALEAITAGAMGQACRQMLDYYDRCYDHELQGRPQAPLLQLQGSGCSDDTLAGQLLQWQAGQAW